MRKWLKGVQGAVLTAVVVCAMLFQGVEVHASSTNTSTAGFVMSGTTVTGYNGTGGSVTIPDTATAIAASAFPEKQIFLQYLSRHRLQVSGITHFRIVPDWSA